MDSSRRSIVAILAISIISGSSPYSHGPRNTRAPEARRQPPTSITKLRAAVQANPRNAESRNALRLALSKSGQIKPAIAEFREAIALKPDYGEAWSNLGNALKQKG